MRHHFAHNTTCSHLSPFLAALRFLMHATASHSLRSAQTADGASKDEGDMSARELFAHHQEHWQGQRAAAKVIAEATLSAGAPFPVARRLRARCAGLEPHRGACSAHRMQPGLPCPALAVEGGGARVLATPATWAAARACGTAAAHAR